MTTQSGGHGRLIVVSNRGPYRLHVTRRGLKREKTIGGLVTSILPMLERLGGTWIAWGEPVGRYAIPPAKPRFQLRYIELNPQQVMRYYHGLSNNALWPLCHYFMGRIRYDRADWEGYEEVNHYFAQTVLEEARPDDTIWVHDYQLTRVPFYIRQERPSARLLFFWHIPFPAAELYRTLPWREQVLKGLLACDVIGFHIPEYTQNFIEACIDLLGAQSHENVLEYHEHLTRVMARPIGIDFQAIEREARTSRIDERVRQIRHTLGDQKLILGVERMDYTKGILERLRGVEYLLEHHPMWHGKICLVQIVTPSRVEVEAYREKKREVDEAVGRINGRFSDGTWIPVRYLHRPFSLAELIAYYRAADIALVTPLRDGLNLVAKEYVAARIHEEGVVILSEFAGVAYQLPEALLTNPYSVDDLASAIQRALLLTKEEQRERMRPMRSRIQAEDISWWAKQFLE